jgi:hypothetical protein
MADSSVNRFLGRADIRSEAIASPANLLGPLYAFAAHGR